MATDPRPPGSKPIGLVAGMVVLASLAAMPFLVVVIFYVVANVQAIITGTRFGSDTVNVGVLLTELAATVALLVVLPAVAVNLIGRALSPKRR